MKIKSYLLLLTSAFIIMSCSKEESVLQEKDSQLISTLNNDLLKFDSFDEYQKTVSEVVSMKLDTLIAYENQRGYKSFGRTCDEFYKSINMDDFKSLEEIKSFVKANSNYLQLIEDENGELELETKLYKSPNRYLLNNYRMFQIGDTVFKEFESGIIMTRFENISDLKNAGNQINSLVQDDRFIYVPNNLNTTNNLKSTNSSCGTEYSETSTNDKNRLKVELKIEKSLGKLKNHYIQRPYKKTLGVWFWCSRTMAADVICEYSWVDKPTGERKAVAYWFYKDWQNASVFEMVNWTNDVDFDNSYYFSSYQIWADTYSVPEIWSRCN